MSNDESTVDTYRCESCGYTEQTEIDETAGDTEERTFGQGRREVEREILVCPECGSDEWLSDSVRSLAETTERAINES